MSGVQHICRPYMRMMEKIRLYEIFEVSSSGLTGRSGDGPSGCDGIVSFVRWLLPAIFVCHEQEYCRWVLISMP